MSTSEYWLSLAVWLSVAAASTVSVASAVDMTRGIRAWLMLIAIWVVGAASGLAMGAARQKAADMRLVDRARVAMGGGLSGLALWAAWWALV